MPDSHVRGSRDLLAGTWTANADGTAIIPVDLADSWIVGSDMLDRDTAVTSKDNRAFFNKVKAAFRAGTSGTKWNDNLVGVNSAAFGNATMATGNSSFAEGYSTEATNTAAHAEGYAAKASGLYSHAEGSSTLASGSHAHAEGTNTTASATGAHAEGSNTSATGTAAHAEGGNTIASGSFSHAQGTLAQATRYGQHSQGAGHFATAGDAQTSTLVVLKQTTDATPTELNASGANAATAVSVAASAINVLTISASRAYQLKASVVARRTDAQGEMAGFTWEGLVGRDSTGSARIIGSPIEAAWGDAPATNNWALTVSINTDTTTNYVAVTATGETGKTIRWVAKLDWVEVGS